MEQVSKKRKQFISKPLFLQSLSSLKVIWIALSAGAALIFIIINLAIGSKNIFTNIDMSSVSTYVKDENLNWNQLIDDIDIEGGDDNGKA